LWPLPPGLAGWLAAAWGVGRLAVHGCRRVEVRIARNDERLGRHETSGSPVLRTHGAKFTGGQSIFSVAKYNEIRENRGNTRNGTKIETYFCDTLHMAKL